MLRGGPGVGRELEELRHGKESSEDGSGHQDGSSQGKEWEDPAGAYCQLLGGSRRLGGETRSRTRVHMGRYSECTGSDRKAEPIRW